jgi:predicted transcriptional regulator
MKTITLTVIGVIVMALVVQYAYPKDSYEYVREEALDATTLEVVPVEPTDVITAAQKELERINAELDAKEQELLKEKADIEAELERLRETRTSF